MATRPLRRTSRRRAVEPRPYLHVVHTTTETRRKTKRPSPVPVVVLIVLAVFGVAALQAWVGQDGLHAAAVEREVQHEQERLTLLRAQVAQLSSPKRLREEANKLGLVAPSEPVFLKAPVDPVSVELTPDATKKLAAPLP
ncbi:MAG TPA: hypothetical protein VFA34_09665 [Actinomycetota bacterium]|jgi:hypothetical protein|nr:hypothetical protein [Actinomycetota bacterium]